MLGWFKRVAGPPSYEELRRRERYARAETHRLSLLREAAEYGISIKDPQMNIFDLMGKVQRWESEHVDRPRYVAEAKELGVHVWPWDSATDIFLRIDRHREYERLHAQYG